MRKAFNIELTIMNPETSDKRKMYLKAAFNKVANSYGNGIYLAISGRGETQYEQLFDLRYEDIDTNHLELVVARWIYANWSGANGSWDVYKLSIESVLDTNNYYKTHEDEESRKCKAATDSTVRNLMHEL